MAIRTAQAEWQGTLREGSGKMKFGSGAYEGKYTWASRFEEAPGTNPEELIGAAHAGCFSMALASGLTKAGFRPEEIRTSARVHLEKVDAGNQITTIELDCQARVPNISQQQFEELAQAAKQGCPVSRALAGVNIQLNARLAN
jgi:lipoyl-dependent peroxiredoxin